MIRAGLPAATLPGGRSWRDDAAGADDAAVADRDPGKHDRAAADPDAVADADRPGVFEPGGAGRAIERVGRRVELHRRPHLQIVADLDRRAVEKDAVVVDEGLAPDADLVAIIAGEARLDVGAVADRAEQLAQQRRAGRRIVRRSSRCIAPAGAARRRRSRRAPGRWRSKARRRASSLFRSSASPSSRPPLFYSFSITTMRRLSLQSSPCPHGDPGG